LKKSNLSSKKPLFAISSCLAGEQVRYDGKSQALGDELAQLEAKYRLLSICPEMAIGLGVPRPPIHLRWSESTQNYRAVLIEQPEVDYTEALHDYAVLLLAKYPELTGVILKQKSPSCGTGKTKLFDRHGELQRADGWGIFAAELLRLRPCLQVLNENNIIYHIKSSGI